MSVDRTLSILTWTALVAVASLAVPGASLSVDVVAKSITTWDAGCGGNTLSAMDDMIGGWYNEVTDSAADPNGHGSSAWTARGNFVDGTFVDSEFIDDGKRSWGKDHVGTNLDAVDAYIYGLHGGNASGDRWFGQVRVDEPGEGNCAAYQGFMLLGNDQLEFLHLVSCYSMDQNDWWPNWSSSFGGLHQISGFHGIAWAGDILVKRWQDFGNDAFETSLYAAFTDNLFYADIKGTDDMCPVQRGVGSTCDDGTTRMVNEQYDNVFSDPPGVSTGNCGRAFYIKGCDPQGKGPLPTN